MKKPEIELSPLDRIRQTESDVIRQIAAARVAAEKAIAEAKDQVKGRLEEAQRSGQCQGQNRYKEIIAQAKEESYALVAQAHSLAENLHDQGQRRMKTAVRHAVNLVIDLEKGGEDR